MRVGATFDVFDTEEAFNEGVVGLTKEIVALAPLTLNGTKVVLRRVSELEPMPEDLDVVAHAYLSEDSKEAMAAFKDRRTPQWTGR